MRNAIASALLILLATAAQAQLPAAEHLPAPSNAPLTWNTGPYAYDGAGNVIAIGSQYFAYDTTNRLVNAHVVTLNASVTQTYTYDAYGNMTLMAGYGPDQNLSPAPSTNHVSGADYDAAGNVTRWQPAGTSAVYSYSYDGAGMMTSLRTGADANPYTVNYVYTADDERVWTYDLSSNDSHFTIRGLNRAVLSDFELKGSTWSLTRDYVYRNGAMSAATSPAGAQYYSLDHLGSPRLLTDDGGFVLGFQTFLPFGQEIAPKIVADGAVKKFTGHERDSDPAGIGNPLDYMHARFYTAMAGRFLSLDPVLGKPNAPQSWNRYAYTADNPLRYTDPDGRIGRCEGNVAQCSADLNKLAPGTKVDQNGMVTKASLLRRIVNHLDGNGAGTALVSSIVNSATVVHISTAPGTGNGGTGGDANNVYVEYDPNGSTNQTRTGPGNSAIAAVHKPGEIVLGHELIHATHIANGTIDAYGFGVHSFSDPSGNYQERWRTEEFRTVGFAGFTQPGDITENQLRHQFGLNDRAAYTEPSNWTPQP